MSPTSPVPPQRFFSAPSSDRVRCFGATKSDHAVHVRDSGIPSKSRLVRRQTLYNQQLTSTESSFASPARFVWMSLGRCVRDVRTVINRRTSVPNEGNQEIWLEYMLDLILRQEFKGERLKGTTIDFSADKPTSALQQSTTELLSITYP